MYKGTWLWIYVIILIFICFLLVLNIFEENKPIVQQEVYLLKSTNGSVTLFEGEKIVAEYDNIVVDNLPIGDRTALLDGIEFDTLQDAQSALEDYDG